jgi:hypothetical protein
MSSFFTKILDKYTIFILMITLFVIQNNLVVWDYYM